MDKKAKFVYFGSSEFSQVVLRELCSKGFMPSLIVSKPDKPKGRGMKLLPTEVSLLASERNIPFIKPESLNGKNIKNLLYEKDADFFIVADYGKIIPSSLLSIPKCLALCVHPSLLPRYRGPAPIEFAIINDEKETGVTIFKINEQVDAGDIILQSKTAIEDKDNFFSLSKKLADNGAAILIEAIGRINNSDYTLTPQNESLVVLTYKLHKTDGKISWNHSALSIRNLIRATSGWPSAYTFYKDLMIKILDADITREESNVIPGTVVAINKLGIYVSASDNLLKITRIKPQGKKEMSAWAFVCGYRLKVGGQFF